jgi:hypothetical protein
MKIIVFKIFLLTLMFGQAFGQSDTSTIYKKLKTKKYYSVGLSSQTQDGQGTYKVNGKVVNKSTYDKYQSTWKNMENCCPCLLESYDENEVLIKESVSCTDCGVGWFKYYYPNGNLKLTGYYKENPTGKWKDIWDRGFCSVKTKQWTYFNENGDTLHSEFWVDGAFIKQIPEQSTSEVWDVDLILDGQKIDKQELPINEVKNLIFIPKYKNSNTTPVVSIKIEVSATGFVPNEKTFTLKTFKNVDISEMLSEAGIPMDKKITVDILLFNGNDSVKSYYFNLTK